jgi:repressor LexA
VKGISRKQSIVLSEIADYVMSHKYPPTVRELSDIVGISHSTLHGYLTRLRSLGLIEWQPERPRTLRLIRQKEVGADAN